MQQSPNKRDSLARPRFLVAVFRDCDPDAKVACPMVWREGGREARPLAVRQLRGTGNRTRRGGTWPASLAHLQRQPIYMHASVEPCNACFGCGPCGRDCHPMPQDSIGLRWEPWLLGIWEPCQVNKQVVRTLRMACSRPVSPSTAQSRIRFCFGSAVGTTRDTPPFYLREREKEKSRSAVDNK